MTTQLPLPAYVAGTTSAPRKGLRFLKELGAALGLLILANILVLGLVGILKANGVPKSVANPLQSLYLPLMWAGLWWLKRKYHISSRLVALTPGTGVGRVLLALLLVGGMAAGIVAVLHGPYHLGITFEVLTTEARRWFFMALLLGAAAAVEELVFRDYILSATQKLTQNFYLLTAVNAAAFLLLHIQGFLMGDYALLWGAAIVSIGLFLAAYVLVFRDLWFPIAFHACWNISTTLYAEDDKTFNLVKFDHYAVHEVLINDVTAAVCISVCLALFALLARQYHRQHQLAPTENQ